MGECKRYTVTAIGRDFEKVVTATNGNEKECSGEIGNCGCIHAEINLLKEMPYPQSVWVSVSPCIDCAKALVESGVKVVGYDKKYRTLAGIDHLKKNGIAVMKITIQPKNSN